MSGFSPGGVGRVTCNEPLIAAIHTRNLTYFRIPLCISLAFEGREDKNNLKNDTIFPRFLATKEKKEIKTY